MSNRKKKLYIAVFAYLRDRFGINPAHFMMDFETSSRKAAREVWPDIKVYGCNFHFNQAVRRKAKSLPRLSLALQRNRAARTTLKMFMRISLLPADRVKKGFKVK